MKRLFRWTWVLTLGMLPAQGHALDFRVSPEVGSCRSETGHLSTTADATTFTVGNGFALTDRWHVALNLELEMASQTFLDTFPAARTLTILDQRGAGLGASLSTPIGGELSWRTEASLLAGTNRTHTAVTYTESQEQLNYNSPYQRLVAATGIVVPISTPVVLSVMAGWREVHFARSPKEIDISGTKANPQGGLTLTYDRVVPEDRATLRAPQSVSGLLLRIGLETKL